MNKLFVITFFTMLSFGALAQTGLDKKAVQDNVANRLRYQGALRSMPKTKDATKGSPYLYKDFKNGFIKLNGKADKYSVKEMRYDILNKQLEVIHQGEVKVIPILELDAVTFSVNGKQVYFVNSRFYGQQRKPFLGLFQVITKGKSQLLKVNKIFIKKATYNVALNVGTNYDELKQKVEYFVTKGKSVFNIDSRRRLYRFFERYDFDAKQYSKKNNLDLKTEEGKKQLVLAFNTFSAKKNIGAN